jgi:tetratricopeptide (TPR) repeat protein
MRSLALAVVAVLALPAAAHGATAAQIADALKDDPVYVGRGADPTISRAQAGRIRVRIARKDLGRIKLAVVPARTAAAAGGLPELAKAIDARLRARGTLIVTAGDTSYVTTSYPQSQAAIVALREAIAANRDGRLGSAMLDGVDNIADVDPGARGDLPQVREQFGEGPRPATPPPAIPSSDDFFDPVEDFFGGVLIAIVAATVLLTAFLVGLVLVAKRRRRRDEAERFAERHDEVDEEFVALGDEIRALDLDVSMPQADVRAVADYEAALYAYEKADELLPRAKTLRHLERVANQVAEGRRLLASARDRFADGYLRGSSGPAV